MLIDVIIFLPLAAALLMLLIPRTSSGVLKAAALAGSLATFILSALVVPLAPNGVTQQVVPWITSGVVASYHVSLGGINVFFVLLTTFVAVPAVWAAWTYANATRLRGYLMLLLAFEWTLLGLFTAGNLLLFYIYWDLMLIPVFLLLVGYAVSPQARRAAWGYLIYNGAGGLILLAGVIGLVVQTHTFEVVGATSGLPAGLEWWLFAAFALAFLIKTPVFPFHAWMPDTYTQSPPPLVAMVSGVQSKAGLYGLIVFALPLFPNAAHAWAPLLLVLAVCSVVYGAFAALAQNNAKTLVAFSSLSHLGLVILALFAFSFSVVQISVLMIVSHGLISAALFLLLGFIEERVGTCELGSFGGLSVRAPRFGVFMLIASMAALGLPGLSGFAGEFLIFLSAWQTQPVFVAISLVSVVIACVYVLKLFQSSMHGPEKLPAGAVRDGLELRPREFALVAPLLAAIIFLGLWPAWLNDRVPASNAVTQASAASMESK
ncbi:MAG TPA: NADH-quinone oxidoreductase subunit M [Candidatus Tumulicola sp.]|nr:NADH-quinone oxidoreductase subunit M [Candidatus Tumulicola sp.]